jgi:hypothetical protein
MEQAITAMFTNNNKNLSKNLKRSEKLVLLLLLFFLESVASTEAMLQLRNRRQNTSTNHPQVPPFRV